MKQLKLYGIASSAFAVFVGLGVPGIAIGVYPIEAKVPADEIRDAVIERRSYRAGYFVLLTGIIIVGIYNRSSKAAGPSSTTLSASSSSPKLFATPSSSATTTSNDHERCDHNQQHPSTAF
ncbi:MAG: hypothetical protein IPF79_05880 [Ignavibacteria bacterium]|nr:hypothetical protein [Ignavibacteria bacterium]